MKTLKHITILSLLIFVVSSCSNLKETAWKMKNLTNDGTSVASYQKDNRRIKKEVKQIEVLETNLFLTASNDNSIILPSIKPIISLKSNASVKSIAVNQNSSKTFLQNKVLKNKIVKTNALPGSGKSQLVALILAIFIGGLGIHRFYLGYIGIGVIQLLTFGGCGIWALIDIIRIAIGDLKPKDGDYTEKL